MKSRDANYKLLEKITAFKAANGIDADGTCGNISDALFKRKKSFHNTEFAGVTRFSFYEAVSAPMLLARLAALFQGLEIKTSGQEGYKVTWETGLIHVKTGKLITFYDYKGAASIGSHFDAIEDKQLIKDLEDLVSVLIDERCPHPYDGCVVGEVA